jgi:hypothetical protein
MGGAGVASAAPRAVSGDRSSPECLCLFNGLSDGLGWPGTGAPECPVPVTAEATSREQAKSTTAAGREPTDRGACRRRFYRDTSGLNSRRWTTNALNFFKVCEVSYRRNGLFVAFGKRVWDFGGYRGIQMQKRMEMLRVGALLGARRSPAFRGRRA